jgi:tetratricopeptide (TPR) repeat protein
VQLTDGETAQQVWSERYEKTAGDMYTFQNEVTGRVARALNLELKEAMSRQAARGPVSDLGAADLALRAWAELWTRRQSPKTNAAALAHVARALELDPENAEAYGVAAYAYARAATYGWGMPREEAIRKGIASGERAVALDSKNADAFYALAFVYVQAGDTLKSQEMLRQSIAINRNHAPAYFFYGLNLIRLGHPRETISWVERAFALSPRDPLRSVWYGAIARAHVAVGDDALAVEAAEKGIASNRNHAHNHAVLAGALANLGRMAEAKAALEELQRVQPGISVSRYWRTIASDDPVARKTNERLMAGLRKAGLPEE